MSDERAILRLTLEQPQRLTDLRLLLSACTLLGMPDDSMVDSNGFPERLVVSCFLDAAGALG